MKTWARSRPSPEFQHRIKVCREIMPPSGGPRLGKMRMFVLPYPARRLVGPPSLLIMKDIIMKRKQMKNVDRAIAGLTTEEKIELVERLRCSIQAETTAAVEMPADETRPSQSTEHATSAAQEESPRRLTEAEFDRYLVDLGLMSRVPDTDADCDDPDDQLVEIRGEPLSETVIRERRIPRG